MRARSIPAATSVTNTLPTHRTALDLALSEARRLHHAARNGSISSAMPVLRRLQAVAILPGQSLTTIYHQRQKIQRKHLLRLLAVEAGFAGWENYRPHLLALGQGDPAIYQAGTLALPTLNHWFTREEEAQLFARAHGGTLLRYGTQAMVIEAGLSQAA